MRDIQVQVNGHEFHVIEHGEGPAVLFCHGFPDTAATWRHQMQAVANAGYHAVALDMRGYGRSYAPDAVELYSAPHIAGDFVGVLDALGIDTAVLVGHDWGADHAQRAAVMRPDRFRAIASISIPFAPRGERSHWDQLRANGLGESYYAFGMMRDGAEADFEPAAQSIPRILHWLSATPPPEVRWDPIDPAKHMLRPAPVDAPDWAATDYVRDTIAAFDRTGFLGGLNYYRAAQVTFDWMAAYKEMLITQPSLYIWGGADGLCRLFHPEPPSRDDLLPTAPGLVDVICFDDVGHWVQHEAPERLSAELLRFLETIGSPEKSA